MYNTHMLETAEIHDALFQLPFHSPEQEFYIQRRQLLQPERK